MISTSLYLIPGAPSRLQRVCIGEDNLLLSYENGTVRLWDVRTKEFWRSMSQDKAQELLQQGGWTELFVFLPILIPCLICQKIRGRWSNFFQFRLETGAGILKRS